MKQMLQFANAALFLIDQFKTQKNSTSRELCHVSEGWEFSKFENQADSNCPIENLQALIGHPRQEFRIWSESNGHVFGSVVPREHTGWGLRTVDWAKDVNEDGHVVLFDSIMAQLASTAAKFTIEIEASGVFKRLVENKFDTNCGCLTSECGRTAIVFTDSVAWSMRTLSSHLASAKTPCASESTEAPADLKMVRNHLTEVPCELGQWLNNCFKKQQQLNKLKEKEKIVSALIHNFHELTCDTLNMPLVSQKPILSIAMDATV